MKRRCFLLKAGVTFVAAVSLPRSLVAASPSHPPVDHSVDIADFVFSPAGLKVRVGDRVTWINKDIVPHTATAKDNSWDTGALAPNQRQTVTVKAGMTESYFCRYHPSMVAKLNLV
jgi:plastocyanin